MRDDGRPEQDAGEPQSHPGIGEQHRDGNVVDQETSEHYSAMARDYEFAHLTGLREALFGLALAYHASGRPDDARRALRRCREIFVEVEALEHLPAIDAYDAYLALLAGDEEQALLWARAHQPGIDSATLHVKGHPAYLRAAILTASGGDAERAEAVALLTELRERAAAAHFSGPLVRFDALSAVAQLRCGDLHGATGAMRRSLATGARHGFTRTYLDLLPEFVTELGALADDLDFPPNVRAELENSLGAQASTTPKPRVQPLADLTEREYEVLTALGQRMSYKEIADQLFISPLTVKTHASSVYAKLGASGRSAAIQAAWEMGWRP